MLSVACIDMQTIHADAGCKKDVSICNHKRQIRPLPGRHVQCLVVLLEAAGWPVGSRFQSFAALAIAQLQRLRAQPFGTQTFRRHIEM